MKFKEVKQYHYIIFYMFSDDYCKDLYNDILLNKKKYFFSIIRFLLKPLVHIIKYLLYPRIKNTDVRNKYIFIIGSINNYNSLKNVYLQLKDESLLIKTGFTNNFPGYNFPMFIPSILSIFYIPLFIYYLITVSEIDKKKLIVFYDKILFSMGYKIFCSLFLKLYKPKSIIFSNDHVFDTRIIVHKAEQMGIKTFYIQHASVTRIFPKLFSSYALLEGADAKNKYIANGSDQNKIILIGMPKFDGLQNFTNKRKKIKSIAICSTFALKKHSVIKLLDEIIIHFKELKIYFRPHTSEYYKRVYKETDLPDNVIFSNPTKESAFQLLKNVDCIISGNSSILLEAALLNVIPFYFVSDQKTRYNDKDLLEDKYGYIKNGITYTIHNIKDLIERIKDFEKSKPNFVKKTKFYCDTIDTEWEGRSATLAANHITNLS